MSLSLARSDDASNSARVRVFHWLSQYVITDDGLAKKGGGIKLAQRLGTNTLDIRPWIIQPVELEQQAAKSTEISDAIIAEAEALTEQQGGGKRTFLLSAFRNGERPIIANLPFTVTIDSGMSSGMNQEGDRSESGPSAVYAQMIQEMHQSMIAMVNSVSLATQRLTTGQGQQLEILQKNQLDTMLLLRALIENKVGQEAEAFATMESAKSWGEIKKTLVSVGIPAAIQHAAPHIMPMLMNWMSHPGNEGAANAIFGAIAAYAQSATQQQQQQQQSNALMPFGGGQ